MNCIRFLTPYSFHSRDGLGRKTNVSTSLFFSVPIEFVREIKVMECGMDVVLSLQKDESSHG